MPQTRRRLLSATVGAIGFGTLGGCVSNSGTDDDGEQSTAQSSFFVFGDIASQIAGDVAATGLLVPVGQHGHGWEPGPRVRETIYNADLFLHGMEGFQPWVDNINSDLEADGTDVTTVDVSSGVDLLEPGGGHDDDHDGHDSHDDDHGSHDEDGHDEHNHGAGMDPHFWMDPLRMKDAVSTVEQELADIDTDNADTYAENTENVRNQLDTLHEQIESTVADGSTDVILVAGHNAFQYFADRYDVEIESLTNLSPDDRPTPRDIERAQDVIEAHSLQYICADPLESQQAAEQLVAETDAQGVLPLTAIPGLNAEWEDNGWGYVEIMENVNLPTLERALDT